MSLLSVNPHPLLITSYIIFDVDVVDVVDVHIFSLKFKSLRISVLYSVG